MTAMSTEAPEPTTPDSDDAPKPGVNDPHPDGAGTDEPLTPM